VSDPSADDHMRAVTALLADLDLAGLPRLVVYNKVDLIDDAHQRRLLRLAPDAVCVCATRRETTRALLDRIARELAGKWDRAAKGPGLEPAGFVEQPQSEAIDELEDPGQLATLDDMLRAAGKRVKSRSGV
jgi:50S ribosomal subunit-associated GTPase HflX